MLHTALISWVSLLTSGLTRNDEAVIYTLIIVGETFQVCQAKAEDPQNFCSGQRMTNITSSPSLPTPSCPIVLDQPPQTHEVKATYCLQNPLLLQTFHPVDIQVACNNLNAQFFFHMICTRKLVSNELNKWAVGTGHGVAKTWWSCYLPWKPGGQTMRACWKGSGRAQICAVPVCRGMLRWATAAMDAAEGW